MSENKKKPAKEEPKPPKPDPKIRTNSFASKSYEKSKKNDDNG